MNYFNKYCKFLIKYDGKRQINVTQFMYNEFWPEDRPPLNRSNFTNLINQVSAKSAEYPHSRITIHGQ